MGEKTVKCGLIKADELTVNGIVYPKEFQQEKI
jgi:hypothetical protein